MRAGIVVTGTEVLTGRVADRNGPWLAEELRRLGVDVGHVVVVGDRPDDLRRRARLPGRHRRRPAHHHRRPRADRRRPHRGGGRPLPGSAVGARPGPRAAHRRDRRAAHGRAAAGRRRPGGRGGRRAQAGAGAGRGRRARAGGHRARPRRPTARRAGTGPSCSCCPDPPPELPRHVGGRARDGAGPRARSPGSSELRQETVRLWARPRGAAGGHPARGRTRAGRAGDHHLHARGRAGDRHPLRARRPARLRPAPRGDARPSTATTLFSTGPTLDELVGAARSPTAASPWRPPSPARAGCSPPG